MHLRLIIIWTELQAIRLKFFTYTFKIVVLNFLCEHSFFTFICIQGPAIVRQASITHILF